MSVKSVIAVGDDQNWKTAVEEVLEDLSRRLKALEDQLAGSRRNGG